jgi:hypothetical protein
VVGERESCGDGVPGRAFDGHINHHDDHHNECLLYF